MEFEQMGEIYVNGEFVDLDNSSIDVLNAMLEKLKGDKYNTLNRINVILEEIQN